MAVQTTRRSLFAGALALSAGASAALATSKPQAAPEAPISTVEASPALRSAAFGWITRFGYEGGRFHWRPDRPDDVWFSAEPAVMVAVDAEVVGPLRAEVKRQLIAEFRAGLRGGA